MAPRHRLGDEGAAHLSGQHGGNRLGEKEPGVRAIARARALNDCRHAGGYACLRERPDIVGPTRAVEVDGKKPTGFVQKERIDAHHLFAGQVRVKSRASTSRNA